MLSFSQNLVHLHVLNCTVGLQLVLLATKLATIQNNKYPCNNVHFIFLKLWTNKKYEKMY